MKLVIEKLSKTYPGGVRALDEVSLEIPRGMFGLLAQWGWQVDFDEDDSYVAGSGFRECDFGGIAGRGAD